MTPGIDLQALRQGAAQRTLTVADYVRLGRELAHTESVDGLRPLKVGILSTCTLSFVDAYLRVEGAARGLGLHTYFGPFGQIEQQVADPTSTLFEFAPDVVVIMLRPEDIDPDVVARHHGSGTSAVIEAAVDRAVQAASQLRKHSQASVLVANFPAPSHPPLGPFDANSSSSLAQALARAGESLRSKLSAVPGCVVWDYAGLVQAHGSLAWSDPRLWALGRIPVAARNQPALAGHLARTLHSLVRPSAKCLVLDLDNTLWGGVIGDDGIEGIKLGDDYPGNVFKNFQRAVLGLADRGILLAVVSKNDADVAEHAIKHHPEMLIRMEHLSASRINWNPKSRNLVEIAKELNIGVDALVCFDDNPVERAEIAAHAPDVLLVDVPADPVGYERALHECGYFDTAVLSDEDRQRVDMYRQERARDLMRDAAGSVEDFLGGLDMVAEVGPVDERNLARVAQLVGKTNQFNLTTRRHSQADIARMASSPAHAVRYLRLRDRFGDLGLIAVGIVEFNGSEARIDSFVMSCRAMGRKAEVALASELASAAHLRGCTTMVGEYLPTARNGIVAELYPSLGFRAEPLQGNGARFRIGLDGAGVQWPDAIRRETASTNGGGDA